MELLAAIFWWLCTTGFLLGVVYTTLAGCPCCVSTGGGGGGVTEITIDCTSVGGLVHQVPSTLHASVVLTDAATCVPRPTVPGSFTVPLIYNNPLPSNVSTTNNWTGYYDFTTPIDSNTCTMVIQVLSGCVSSGGHCPDTHFNLSVSMFIGRGIYPPFGPLESDCHPSATTTMTSCDDPVSLSWSSGLFACDFDICCNGTNLHVVITVTN